MRWGRVTIVAAGILSALLAAGGLLTWTNSWLKGKEVTEGISWWSSFISHRTMAGSLTGILIIFLVIDVAAIVILVIAANSKAQQEAISGDARDTTEQTQLQPTASSPDVRISILHHTFCVRDRKGGRLYQAHSHDPLDLSHFPPGVLQLELAVSILIYPQLLVENMQLQVDKSHKPIDAEEWRSERMETEYTRELRFTIPPDVMPGEHSITVLATVDGQSWQSSSRPVQFPKAPPTSGG